LKKSLPYARYDYKKIFENLELIKLRDWLLPILMNGQTTEEEGSSDKTELN
jgi:hypothetical protein